MEKLFKFLQADPNKQLILIEVFIIQLVVRLALCILPFYRVLSILQRLEYFALAKGKCERKWIFNIQHNIKLLECYVVWAVLKTSPYVPGSRCLCQAITCQILMTFNGIKTELRIGVNKSNGTLLMAHAWLTQHDRIVIGNLPNLSDYIPFSSLPTVLS